MDIDLQRIFYVFVEKFACKTLLFKHDVIISQLLSLSTTTKIYIYMSMKNESARKKQNQNKGKRKKNE